MPLCVHSGWLVGVLHSGCLKWRCSVALAAKSRKSHRNRNRSDRENRISAKARVNCVRVHENRETSRGVSVCRGVFHSGWLACYILVAWSGVVLLR